MGLFDAFREDNGAETVAPPQGTLSVVAQSQALQRPSTAVIASGCGSESLTLTVREITGVDIARFQEPALAVRPQQLPILSQIPPDEREELRQQEHFLKEVWHRWKVNGLKFDEAVTSAVADLQEHWPLLARGGKFDGTRLTVVNARNWLRTIGRRANGEPRWDNIAALRKHYERGQRELSIDPDFLQRFTKLYLSPGERTAFGAWKIAKREFLADGMGAAVADFHRIDYFARTRLSEQVKMRARSPKDYKNLIRGFVNRHRNFGPGDVWFADHRLCDFWVRHPHPQTGEMIAIRPYVTAVMDAFTGKILAWVIYADQNPNWRRVAEAMALALHNAGNRPPLVWYVDNGKDFLKRGWARGIRLMTRQGELLHHDGQPFDHSVLRELGSRLQLARGYNGKEKPVERLFRDQAVDFDRFQPGYCGNSPATRPDYGDTWQGDINRLSTLGQVLEQLDTWVNEHNAAAAGKPSANALWDAAVWTRPAFTNEQLTMALLLPSPVALKVDRTGYGMGGVNYAGARYTHLGLRTANDGKGLWGEYVMVKTHWGLPDIVTADGHRHPPAVFLFHPDGRFICIAFAEVTAAELAQTAEEKRLLGEICHVIAAAAKLDMAELERRTGCPRVVQTTPILPALPAVTGSAVSRGASGLGSRRLPAAADTHTAGPRTIPTAHVSDDLLKTMASVVFTDDLTDDDSPDADAIPEDAFAQPSRAETPAPAADEDLKHTLAALEEYR